MNKIKGAVVSSNKVKLVSDNYYFIKISENPERDKKELVLVVNSQGHNFTVDDVEIMTCNFYPGEEVFGLPMSSQMLGTGFNPEVYESVTPAEDLL